MTLTDRFGRPITYLRISVTDRCNLRCVYCLPEAGVKWQPRENQLSAEEIARVAETAAKVGVRRVRLTGGEPLVRHELPRLIERLARVPGIDDIALTTNGILLEEQAQALKDAGLQRLNISLDTLQEEVFRRISRREGLDRVLAGIAAAKRVGFRKIRLNAVAIRDLTETEAADLVRFARERDLEMRFIEYMPLDAEQHWKAERTLSGAEIRRALEQAVGPLEPAQRDNPSQPARDYRFVEGGGTVGFINPVSEPFCGDCNRLRVTAEGKLRNCLFSQTEWDVRGLLRSGATDAQIESRARDCVLAKKPGHGLDAPDFLRPERAMYQIGG